MGISGIFKELGPPPRTSLLSLSTTHLTTHSRPLRLAIDTSIWLFQIQAAQGGSNPALRTFYYRLLRLQSHNIHPLFVFDGPNKPTWKRNKKVGGPGVRVASVPEFLAKQLLKQFGFPFHIAPGEAEAECASLQKEGVVDFVMSEDVDTLMFGSLCTVRNWSPWTPKGKVPTHVDVFRADETLARSGLDREGMILVALMSGGDYIVEGIPGCGPKVACDAARAGFGRELCTIAGMRDLGGLREWRERLQREIRTNEGKFFTRRSKLVIPEDFPNREVLGYYTNPCVSSPAKVEELRRTLRWDQEIDFLALRAFTADAFDWRCISGAKKFVRNLAPAMLVRQLRLAPQPPQQQEEMERTFQQQIALETQEQREKLLVTTIHSKRTHVSTDNLLEYRISFTPLNLVPIDLSLEDEDDPVGGEVEGEVDSEWNSMPSSTIGEEEATIRGPSLYDPAQPEKLWILADFLKLGCPVMVRMYEDGGGDPKKLLKARREAREKVANIHAKGKGKKKVAGSDMPRDALMAYTTTTKTSSQSVEKDAYEKDGGAQKKVVGRAPLKDLSPRTSAVRGNAVKKSAATAKGKEAAAAAAAATKERDNEAAPSGFRRMESTRDWVPVAPSQTTATTDLSFAHQDVEEEDQDPTPKPVRTSKVTAAPKPKPKTTAPKDTSRPFAQFATTTKVNKATPTTPTRKKQLKRPCSDVMSSAKSQRTIDSYWSPTPKKQLPLPMPEVVSLLSSSPAKPPPFPPIRSNSGNELEGGFLGDLDLRREDDNLDVDMSLPASVTKRAPRRRERTLKRAKTAPVAFGGEEEEEEELGIVDFSGKGRSKVVEEMDLASPSPVRRRVVEDVNVLPPIRFSGTAMSPPSATVRQSSPPRLSAPKALSPPPPRRSPRTSLPRVLTSVSMKPKKQRIQLRESLAGSFKFVDAEMLDLTGDIAGGVKVHGERKVRSWRESGVEVLDLTDD